jgi:uncharacterized protein (UPF0303 family)
MCWSVSEAAQMLRRKKNITGRKQKHSPQRDWCQQAQQQEQLPTQQTLPNT